MGAGILSDKLTVVRVQLIEDCYIYLRIDMVDPVCPKRPNRREESDLNVERNMIFAIIFSEEQGLRQPQVCVRCISTCQEEPNFCDPSSNFVVQRLYFPSPLIEIRWNDSNNGEKV